MAAGLYVEWEGQELGITEGELLRLQAAGIVTPESCDECSSTFGGRAVYHLEGDYTVGDMRRVIRGEVARNGH